jgi:hypothetical protein
VTETEQGFRWAAQLNDYCEAYGCTPAAALDDPMLTFNATIRNTALWWREREMERERLKAEMHTSGRSRG